MTLPAANSMPGSPRDDEGIDFGRYRIFPKLRLLLRDGVKIDIGARAFDVLWVLVRADGALVPKDDLIDAVWSGAVVEENNLQAQMSAIRRALGPDRDMIRTEFGRGYRLAPEGQESSRARTGPARPTPSALPQPLTPLLGRTGDLDEIERLLAKSRLVTITGAGGIGKTRLALAIGRSVADRLPDGVHLAEMAKISEDDLVGPTLAAALQIASDLEWTGQLQAALRDKRLLLIIDNCEHLTGPIAQAVEAILRQAGGIQILVTSQEPLGAEGEQIYRLAPLAVPPAGTRDAAVAMAHTAFELFVERASAGGRTLSLDGDTVAIATTICQRLDGLPLALELAAARVASLGVHGVLAALDDRFRLLTAGRRTALARHRTLRATVDWSYHLLDEAERRMFRRLSIFAASFDTDAASAVAAPEHDDPWSSIDLLGGLVSKSLLLLDRDQPIPRYRFLETIRFYALEKLADSGEVDLTAARHATYVAEVVHQASEDWKVLPTDAWRAAYQDIAEDLRASLDWAFSETGDTTTGIGLLAHAPPFWMLLSLHDECRRRTIQVLNHSSEGAALEPADEMKLNAALGTALSWATGPVRNTRSAWERALTLAGQLSVTEVELQAQYGLWLYSLRRGSYALALDHATAMIHLAAMAGDDEAVAVGRRIAGVAHHFLGHHDEGRALIEDSLTWHEAHQPQQPFRFGLDQRIAGLAFLSRLLWVQGFSDRAKATAAAAATEARALDHANTLCCALAEGWCTVHALDGNHEAVTREVTALKHVARQHGLGFWKLYGDLFELWAQTRGGTDVPASHIEALMAAIEAADFAPGYSILLSDILLATHAKGSVTPSLSRLASTFLQRSLDSFWAEPEFRRVQARLGVSPDGLLPSLREALAMSERQHAPAWTLRIAVDLAQDLVAQDLVDQDLADQDLADQEKRREARTILATALASLPGENRSADAMAARTLAARLAG